MNEFINRFEELQCISSATQYIEMHSWVHSVESTDLHLRGLMCGDNYQIVWKYSAHIEYIYSISWISTPIYHNGEILYLIF